MWEGLWFCLALLSHKPSMSGDCRYRRRFGSARAAACSQASGRLRGAADGRLAALVAGAAHGLRLGVELGVVRLGGVGLRAVRLPGGGPAVALDIQVGVDWGRGVGEGGQGYRGE